jgi:Flp pilus assembly protein TadG
MYKKLFRHAISLFLSVCRNIDSERSAIKPASDCRGVSSGQDLIEFALVVPLLVLFVFGTLDLGRLFYGLIVVTNAAREGARYGISNGMLVSDGIFIPKVNEIIGAARQEAASSGVSLNDSIIEVTCPQGCDSGNALKVSVQYNFTPFITGILNDSSLTVTRSVEMMVP